MSPEQHWPPRVGELLPRACAAYAASEKLAWILSDAGHGKEWARVLHIGSGDTQRFWEALAEAALDAPIFKVIDRKPHGVSCGLQTTVVIGKRTSRARTFWHYQSARDAPRLVTAYPRP